MKKLLLTVTAMSALAAAAPAAAQYGSQGNYNNQANNQGYNNQGYGNQGYGNQGYNNSGNWNGGGQMDMSGRISQLEARLQAGIQSGDIDRTEGREIRQDLRDLRRLERQYSADGLSQTERRDLQQRLRTVRQDIRLADNGRYDRDTRYGNWQDDGSTYGQGGPYEEPCQQRSGLGGLVDTVLGQDACGGLQVGQRATGNLYAVPSQYRNQYRDGNGVYYRSDGRSIYQIDARTNSVVRVYGMNR